MFASFQHGVVGLLALPEMWCALFVVLKSFLSRHRHRQHQSSRTLTSCNFCSQVHELADKILLYFQRALEQNIIVLVQPTTKSVIAYRSITFQYRKQERDRVQ